MKIIGNLDFTNSGYLQQTSFGVETGSVDGNGFPLAANINVGRIAFVNSRLWIAVEILDGVVTWIALTDEINGYEFTQASNSSTWVITHNLATSFPVVQVYDSSNSVIIPESITVTDANTVTVTFTSAISGKAIVLSGDVGGSAVPSVVSIAGGGTGQTTASAAFDALSPITTTGDLIYSSGGTTNARLGIGSTGQVLTVSGGVPAWQNPASGGSPAGSTGYVQYNNAGNFAASSNFTFTAASNTLYAKGLSSTSFAIDSSTGAMTVSGSKGNSGDVLTSSGSSTAPNWQSPYYATTFAFLPPGQPGLRTVITDSTSNTFYDGDVLSGGTLAGGGMYTVPVFYDATNNTWRVG